MLNEIFGELDETYDDVLRRIVYSRDERRDEARSSDEKHRDDGTRACSSQDAESDGGCEAYKSDDGMVDYHPDGYMDSLLESACPVGELSDVPAPKEEPAPDSFAEQPMYTDPYAYDEVEELDTLTADELMHLYFPKKEFIVSTLLTPGLAVLAGAPKIGKSWMVLDMCLKIAKGEAFLGLDTRQGSVLYLALEDDRYRLHRRLLRIADEGSEHMRVAHRCSAEPEALEKQIKLFISQRPDTRLIVIDTFQKIRRSVREMSYANDYAEVSRLKSIADREGVCILLVHHTRKLGDSDYMNEISGTNGIAGSADTLMVLKKDKRNSREATLSCTGRDIEDREMTLSLDRETCIWQVRSDSLKKPEEDIPDEISELIELMKDIKTYSGTNSDFTDLFCSERKFAINPNRLKRSMNLWRDELLRHGIEFVSLKSCGRRSLAISYFADRDTADSGRDDAGTV